jgi:hypothetical protein
MTGINTGTKSSKIVVFLWPIIFILICLYIKVSNNDAYRSMVREDAVIENMTCVACLLASVFALSVAQGFFKDRRQRYAWLYVLAFLFFFFIGMEEISWGQRIFHTKTPEYLIEHNVQEETNIHNLRALHALTTPSYVLVCLAGTCGWMFLCHPKLKGLRSQAKYLIPGWYLSLYFFFSLLIGLYLKVAAILGRLEFFTWRDMEPAELLMSMGFCLFAAAAKHRQLQGIQVEPSAIEEQVSAGGGLAPTEV